jgi:hypothetical protein
VTKPIASFLFLLLFFPQSISAAITDGLNAYYRFEGNANDSSGKGNHATASGGVTFASGVAGSAVRFDGSSGQLHANDTSVGNLATNATVAFWFYADASNFASGEHRMAEKAGGAFWTFGLHSAGLTVGLRGSNLPGPAESEFEILNPEFFTEFWTAIALRKTGSTFELFVNGTLVGTRLTSIGNISPSGLLNFGSSALAGSQFYSGLIDEAMVFDRALSNAEIGLLASPSSLPIPEPHAYVLLLAGLGLVYGAYRRRGRTGSGSLHIHRS